MASGAISKLTKPVIENISDFAKSFKNKFDIDAYHGSRQDVAKNPQIRMFDGKPEEVLIEEKGAPIKAFLDKDISEGDTSAIQDLGTWFSEEPEVANWFAQENINSKVYPVKLKLENPKIYDGYETLEAEFEDFMYNINRNKPWYEEQGSKAFRDQLKDKGHDGILIENSMTDIGINRKDYVVFDPKNIRSRFAKFDPTKADSRDILAGAGYTAFGTLGGLAGLEEGT